MALKVSSRGLISPFIVMDVMRAANERAASGKDVLHLEVGQPGTPAPGAVLDRAKSALDEDLIGYTDALGIPALRNLIAEQYKIRYGADVDPGQVMITTGSSGGFLLSFLAAFDAGDRVALAAPGYPAYRNILTALGIEAVTIEVGPETHFQPTPGVLEKAGQAIDGLIVASPSNPTGSMIMEPEMRQLTDWCRNKGVRLISDEIYHGITFGPDPVTALAFDPDAVVINSFSKYCSMTGWRLGWMVVPEPLLRSVECLTQNLFISPPTLSQIAATAVFDCRDELDRYVGQYAENRELLLRELPRAGFREFAPADGAFYLYADVSHLTDDSDAFCRKMLAETGVAATPGIDFDPGRGHRYLRFSFAGANDVMAGAAERLIGWLA